MALDSDLSDFAYNLSIQTSQSFSFFQDDNNQQPPQNLLHNYNHKEDSRKR